MNFSSPPTIPGPGGQIPLNQATLAQGQGFWAQSRSYFQRFSNWIWIPGWSMPSQGAALTAFVLAGSVIAAWIIFHRDPNSVPWRYAITAEYLAILIGLVVVIPWFVYRGLSAFLAGDKALFPDIDFAWSAGLEALRANGLSLETIPVFLIIGSGREEDEIGLLTASGKGFRVRGIPEGPAPLHWYAHPDAIYVCCTETSILSSLARLAQQNSRDAASGRLALSPVGGNVTPSSSTGLPSVSSSWAGQHSLSDRSLNVLSMQQASAASARLRTVCRLLSLARDPASPINGVIVMLPYAIAEATPREVQELAEAVDNDLQNIQETLQVRAPVTALVTGLEEEPGFRELMRRVGVERTKLQRFGQHFDLRADTEGPELERFCEHACGAFEDWAQALFRENDVLSRPGNLQLFALICEVRSRLKQPLSQVLARGFGYNPQEQSSEKRHLFSGCYFVANGRSPDQHAFVRGVVDQLESEQDAVEWTTAAYRRNTRLQTGFAMAVMANIAMIGVFAYQILVTRMP